ncbi:3-oxoacyl-(acyl-carrier-protein) synthase [Flavobacteriaceae bacterium MAR_2010_188]|nr:3-oxoacyl-(acyl-carrier-protein) synthase [Flavobacteriaceae bacterium MAR_2010_188]
MDFPISIVGISSISPLGANREEVLQSYRRSQPKITSKTINNSEVAVAELSKESKAIIENLKVSNQKYKSLDDTVLFSIYASRNATAEANWAKKNNFGINIGSSRGATQLFEKFHREFIRDKKLSALASPTTTLGNISSWVAQDLLSDGPAISHSITCSTSLHAMLNAIAWIKSGLCDSFLVGGSEAPLTDFTIAQMQALKIYSRNQSEYPCQPLNFDKEENTMILGEAAGSACLQKGILKNRLAIIEGFGFGNEPLTHNVSVSPDAICFQKSITMALTTIHPEEIDIIITHTPGTIKGDLSELNAIETVFKNKMPALTCNKWQIGHTLGASGILSVEMAILMLQNQEYFEVPYLPTKEPEKIKRIMINSVGFGGNAVSIVLKHPSC